MIRLRSAGALVAGLAILASACQDGTEPVRPDPSPGSPLFQHTPAHASAPDRLALARSIPGFGGLFLDGSGIPTVHLTDRSQRGAAERALEGFMRQRGLAPSQLQVREGAFEYRALDGWFNRAWPEAFGVQGVVFADLNETRNRLVFGVVDAAAARGVRGAVARLGIPDEAVVVEVTEPIRPLVSLQGLASSIVGGVQIHFGNYLCTLGFNALSGTQESFITNSHCTNTQGGTEGTQYYQPTSTVDPAVIGTEVDDPQYFRGGECPRGYKCRYSDASRARRESVRTFTRGAIARTSGLGSLDVVGSFNITGEFAQGSVGSNCIVEGTTLHKVGRTTGWSSGQVTNSCIHVGVSGSNMAQLYQVMVAASVGSGDSGSPVFHWSGSGDDVTLHGILWGGSSASFVFSPMANVEHELGALTVTADGGSPTPTDPPPSGSITLTAVNTGKVKGTSTVVLDWSPESPAVDVYANGAVIGTNDGDGTHVHEVKGGGTVTYQVCETGSTSNCSNTETVTL